MRPKVIGKPVVVLNLTVNGQSFSVPVEPRRTLLDFIRDELKLTGAKKGCETGNCGACTVLVDGRSQLSCLTFAVSCEGRRVLTVEGLAHDGKLHEIQKAFVENDAFQCGFCTPGQIMSAKFLLDQKPDPTLEEIGIAMSGNLCRCGAYQNIMKAVLDVSKRIGGGR